MLVSVKKSKFVLLIGITTIAIYLLNCYTSEIPVSIDKSGRERLNPSGPNVYLIETSAGKLHLTNREACSVESAALQHLTSTVTVYNVNGQFNLSNRYVQLISTIPNVRLLHLNVSQAFQDTPLDDQWYKRNAINSSLYPTEHMSDALRLALLWKQGGIYMDTDIIVIRSMQHLRNTVGCQTLSISNGVLIFDRNSSLLHTYMKRFATTFVGVLYNYPGPMMLTGILMDVCKTISLQSVIDKPSQCQGVHIRSSNSFAPVSWFDWSRQFDNDFNPDLSDSFTVHLYGSVSRVKVAKANDGSFIDRLFQRNCPLSYELMKHDGII